MNFVSEKNGKIVIEKIKVTRGTFLEAEELKKNISKNIEKGNIFIVLDFAECHFIDSTFLGTIVTSLKKLLALGGSLKIANLHSEALEFMELTGTYKILEAFDSVKEAVESFSSK